MNQAPAPVSNPVQREQQQLQQLTPSTDASMMNGLAHQSSQGDEATQPGEDPGANVESQLPSQSQPTAGAPASSGQLADAGGEPQRLPESRMPTKKDVSLRDFLSKIDDYAPMIPDAVTDYLMTRSGLPPPPQTDRHYARLLALCTQKFIADVAAEAYQFSRIRASNTNSTNNSMGNLGGAAPGAGGVPQGPGGLAAALGGGKATAPGEKGNAALGVQRPGYGGGGQGGSQNRTVLTMEDLGMAAAEYGVNVKRSEFYR